MKVFGIGLQKTGTSSLGRALEILGFKINHALNDNLINYLLDAELDKLYDEVEKWDAFEDNPWPMIYKELDHKYPGSKFILTVRDENSWIESIVKHFGSRTSEFQKWFYKAPYPKGNESKFIQTYHSHNKEVVDYFKNRKDALLIVDWEKGDGWDKLCGFLGKDIPQKPFPHWNKNKTFMDYIKKRVRGLKLRLRKLIK